MAESSRRFNFDDFDEQIAEALAEHEAWRSTLRSTNVGTAAVRFVDGEAIQDLPDISTVGEKPDAV